MKTFLTPGPSQLYFTYDFHLKQALREHIGSISHRSQDFKKIYAHTVEQLKVLLAVPEDFHIVFTSSATEVWERIIQNQVANKSTHLVNGAFAQKFASIAKDLGRDVQTIKGPENNGFKNVDLDIDPESELIAVTQNETSMGSMFPLEQIGELRNRYPEKLIAVDGVSSVPYPEFDFTQFDHLYFSVQKCFGLPAGLGVWIVSKRALERSIQLASQGSIGSYHQLPKLVEMSKKLQTPETPNVLNIYTLGKVAEDMNNKGLDMIRRETNYKYALLNQLVESHPKLTPFIKDEPYRSRTVYVAQTPECQKIIEEMNKHQIVLGTGYGKYKNHHIRIANFPTISKERMEMMVDLLEEIEF